MLLCTVLAALADMIPRLILWLSTACAWSCTFSIFRQHWDIAMLHELLSLMSLMCLQGGKLDDITAVVAIVQKSEEDVSMGPTTPHVSEGRLHTSLSGV